jgi:hypothetical protein
LSPTEGLSFGIGRDDKTPVAGSGRVPGPLSYDRSQSQGQGQSQSQSQRQRQRQRQSPGQGLFDRTVKVASMLTVAFPGVKLMEDAINRFTLQIEEIKPITSRY